MSVKKPSSPVKSSTQDFTEIEAVRDDVLLMKDNSCSIIIKVGAINFGLLSEEEQRSLIYSFSSLLNSLSFPVQILILSRKMDISSYLDYIAEKINSQSSDMVRQRLVKYEEFIKNIIKKNTILEKSFYYVVPFSPLEMGVKASTKHSFDKEYVFSRAKISLYPKKDHLLRLLQKTGLGGTVLYEQDIVELFYNLYNPSATGRKLAPVKSYTDIVLSS